MLGKQSLVTVALGAGIIFTPALSAQSTTSPSAKPIGSCSSGLSGGGPGCRPERRLLIDIRRHGEGAPTELRDVVAMGASAAGIFSLNSDQATAADSTLYAVIDVRRAASGQYRIEQSITGSVVATRNNCSASSTGKLGDLAFGAYLATATAQLVRCAQHARSQIGTQ